MAEPWKSSRPVEPGSQLAGSRWLTASRPCSEESKFFSQHDTNARENPDKPWSGSPYVREVDCILALAQGYIEKETECRKVSISEGAKRHHLLSLSGQSPKGQKQQARSQGSAPGCGPLLIGSQLLSLLNRLWATFSVSHPLCTTTSGLQGWIWDPVPSPSQSSVKTYREEAQRKTEGGHFSQQHPGWKPLWAENPLPWDWGFPDCATGKGRFSLKTFKLFRSWEQRFSAQSFAWASGPKFPESVGRGHPGNPQAHGKEGSGENLGWNPQFPLYFPLPWAWFARCLLLMDSGNFGPLRLEHS